MTSPTFEDLGIPPELVEALALEGMEIPTAFQREAIPVLRKGNPLLAGAGPGAGTLVAYGVPLLERVDASETGLGALVLVPTPDAAHGLALSLARLAAVSGHRIAALGPSWAMPEQAHILLGTPSQLLGAVRESRIKLDTLIALVLDGAGVMEDLGEWEAVTTLLELSPKDAQKVVLSQPISATVRASVGTYLRRAVEVPARPAVEGAREAVPHRGSLRYRVVEPPPDRALVGEVSRLLQQEEAHHVLLFCRSEDRAADAGDLLTLHGFLAGAPGDADVPVWLAVDELEARKALDERTGGREEVATLSLEVPPDPDSLDRRHHGGGGVILILPRELPHLRDLASRTGYSIAPLPPLGPTGTQAAEAIRSAVTTALKERSLAGPLLILEPLFQEYSAAEVAAALLALSDISQGPREAAPAVTSYSPTEQASQSGSQASPVQAWVRVFISLGEKDGIRAGDVLGAVTGESGVQGSRIGRIEIRDSFSLVEVEKEVADQVIRSLNGVTVKGRSVRADYDRKEARQQAMGRAPTPRGGPPGRGAPRGGSPRKGPPRRGPRGDS
ncbi:MAG: DEAD/DEAH box helicase [Gemmatimonadota bacterium]